MSGMREGSVVWRLKRFFEQNADEELTYTDICTKFECSHAAASDAVKQLKHSGLVESVNVIRNRKKGMGL